MCEGSRHLSLQLDAVPICLVDATLQTWIVLHGMSMTFCNSPTTSYGYPVAGYPTVGYPMSGCAMLSNPMLGNPIVEGFIDSHIAWDSHWILDRTLTPAAFSLSDRQI